MKKFFIFLILSVLAFAKPKVLHITFHVGKGSGCAGEVSYICKMFDLELDTWLLLNQPNRFFDPVSRPVANYIMNHDRAERIFNKHKATFEKYDLIITSDISPLSRVFLQNNWKKPLLIWVCNRFDINVKSNGFRIFPDDEYLKLFNDAQYLSNVEIVGYTNYEKYHAETNRNVTSIKHTITPTGMNDNAKGYRRIDPTVNKQDTFFVRKYINERATRLTKILKRHDINSYSGNYAGSRDLKDFRGMIHIPCVMGNLHLWENLSKGIVHFIPSKEFYQKLYLAHKISLWDWTNPNKRASFIPIKEVFDYCDWYNEKLAPLFVFYDSYADLKRLTEETDYEAKKALISSWYKGHVLHSLEAWEPIFTRLIGTGKQNFAWEGDQVIHLN